MWVGIVVIGIAAAMWAMLVAHYHTKRYISKKHKYGDSEFVKQTLESTVDSGLIAAMGLTIVYIEAIFDMLTL